MTKDKWIIALLATCLVLNLIVLSNLNELNQELSRVQGEMSSLRNHVTSEVSNIRETVQNIRDDSRWWTPAQMEILNIDKETATIRLSWQLREYLKGNRVALNYQIGNGDFKEVAAKESANGFFSVDLTIALPLEPLWDISVNLERKSDVRQFTIGQTHNVQAVEEHFIDGPGPQLIYFISVLDGATTRTSDMRTVELGKLSYNLFSPLHTHVRMSNDEITVTVYEHQGREPHYNINTVRMESRSNNRVVEQWPLNENTNARGGLDREIIFDARPIIPDKFYDTLFIVIDYSEDLQVEKRLPIN